MQTMLPFCDFLGFSFVSKEVIIKVCSYHNWGTLLLSCRDLTFNKADGSLPIYHIYRIKYPNILYAIPALCTLSPLSQWLSTDMAQVHLRVGCGSNINKRRKECEVLRKVTSSMFKARSTVFTKLLQHLTCS